MGFPLRLSKKWLAPLFRGFHSSLAPTARLGSYAEKPLLRKAFCGFAVHAAKSDYSLRGLRPPNPQGFFDRLRGKLVGFPLFAVDGLFVPNSVPVHIAGLQRIVALGSRVCNDVSIPGVNPQRLGLPIGRIGQ